MTTPPTRADDGRPPAVRHAEIGEEAWCAAARAQLTARPDHSDFYDLAGYLSPTLRSLMNLADLLVRQISTYGDGRPVYDDTRTVDPSVRLARAVEQLRGTRGALADAHSHAEAYWSEIAHIGVEVAP